MLSDVPSAPRFLVDVFSFVVHAEFEVGVLAPEEFRWKLSSCARFARQDYKVATLGNIYLPTMLSIVLIFILSLASYVNLNSNLRSRYNILL